MLLPVTEQKKKNKDANKKKQIKGKKASKAKVFKSFANSRDLIFLIEGPLKHFRRVTGGFDEKNELTSFHLILLLRGEGKKGLHKTV